MTSKLQYKLCLLNNEINKTVIELLEMMGEKSCFMHQTVFKIKDEKYMFNLEAGRYLSEITETNLVDNFGYCYSWDTLSVGEWCEMLDSFN
ncbi:MAG: hypothetical protein LBE82_09810 [Chitinophagaceae bacterium]|jgi:hypothetical protein|nr:hypothetical protein [Chitinophagaceae bacterium]